MTPEQRTKLEALADAARGTDRQIEEKNLCEELAQYCKAHGLREACAMELLHEIKTDEHRKWLSDFVVRWEQWEQEGGTDRQIDAEIAFHNFVSDDLGVNTDDMQTAKATRDDMINEALRRAEEKHLLEEYEAWMADRKYENLCARELQHELMGALAEQKPGDLVWLCDFADRWERWEQWKEWDTSPFQKFRATKRVVFDLSTITSIAEDKNKPGFVYCDALVISHRTPEWPAKVQAFQYHLILANQEWFSNDLRELEHRLFDFAEAEGYAS